MLYDSDDTFDWLQTSLANIKVHIVHSILINLHGHVNKPHYIVQTNQCLTLPFAVQLSESVEKKNPNRSKPNISIENELYWK